MRTLIALLLLASPALAQDAPAELPQRIDSWYRLEQSIGRTWVHVGYVRETLAASPSTVWAWEYSWDLGYVITNRDSNPVRGSCWFEAQLEPDLSVRRLDGAARHNDQDSRGIRVRSEENWRRLRVDVDGASTHEIRWTPDDPATPCGQLALMAAWQAGALTGERDIRWLDVWEARGLTKVSTSAPRAVRTDVLGRNVAALQLTVRDLRLAPELAEFSRVTIDRWGRLLAAESADGTWRLSLVEGESQALGTDAMLRALAMRDPLDKRKALRNKEDEIVEYTTTLESVGRVRPQDVDAEFQRLPDKLAALRQAVTADKLEEARAVYDRIVRIYKEIHRHLDGVRQGNIEKMRADAEGLFGGVERLLRQARALEEMIRNFALARSLDSALSRQATLELLPDRPELWRREERDIVEKLVLQGRRHVELCRASIRLDAIPIELTGTAVTGDPRTTWCVINDERYRAGDVIKGARIDAITRDRVVLSLEGATRDVGLKR